MKKTTLILFSTLIFGFIAGSSLAMDTADVDIHGFLSQGYLKTTEYNFFGDTEDGSIEFNEFGINFASDLSDKLRVGLQILTRDFGNYGNNEMNIDWAYGDYRWKDYLGFRAGKIKTPKGLYNETRDVDMLRTTVFLPQSVYPEILREVDLGLFGAGVYGYIDLNAAGMLSYQAVCGTQDITPGEGASQALQGTTATEAPVSNDYIDVDSKYAAGIVWDTPLDGLRMGLSFDSSDLTEASSFTDALPDMEGTQVVAKFDTFQNTVLSAEYTIGNLILAAEYIQTEKAFTHYIEDRTLPISMTADGWYLSSAYQFNDWFALGGYYSASYNDKDDRDGEGLSGNPMMPATTHRAYFKDFCLTTAFTIDYNWSIKLEGHRFTGTNGVIPTDQEGGGSDFAEEDWNLFAIKTTYSF